jgi:glycosyltransferase involved in cell wall biosynthesis
VSGLGLLRRCEADVVYVSTLTIPLWLLLARLVRRPAVCHVHEAERSAPVVQRRVLAFPLRWAQSVVVNSRYSLEVLTAAAPGAGARATVVHNGVPGPERPVPARERPDPPVRLLYVGRLSPRKGVDVAVAALGELLERGVPARLDLVGDVFPGYEWYEADLRRQATAAGTQDVLAFHGFQVDVWPFAAAADVMIVPSRLDESFGNTAVEAALAARPLVVSDTSGLREAAAGLAAALVVPPDDAQALASAVEQVLADWPAYRERAVEDHAVVRDRHDPRRYRRAVADVVAGVLPAPGAAAVARPREAS